MRVLSLFDGISCGMVALERAKIPVEQYTAYEIDKYALKISKKNYPQIEHCGDVCEGNFKQYRGYNLLLGGSPCTYWSIAKNNREITSDGEGFRLFMQYIRALEESGCEFFLYENNYSIHQNIKDEISRRLGVEPIMINSALVSAQHRKRCYWTNIPVFSQPKDKKILLKDILVSGIPWQKKAYAYTTSCQNAMFEDTLKHYRHTMVAEPVVLNDIDGKARTLKAQYANTGLANAVRNDNFGATMIAEPLQIRTISSGKSKNNGKSYITVPVKLGEIGTGGQANRVYSVYGKSVSLGATSGGAGAKTGLYKIDLPDGNYIIRKLYPIEAERLQTLPDNYTAGISPTQRYKCIGNGWTVDVIKFILKGGRN